MIFFCYTIVPVRPGKSPWPAKVPAIRYTRSVPRRRATILRWKQGPYVRTVPTQGPFFVLSSPPARWSSAVLAACPPSPEAATRGRHTIVNASGNSNVACDMGPASIRSLASTIQRSAARCSRWTNDFVVDRRCGCSFVATCVSFLLLSWPKRVWEVWLFKHHLTLLFYLIFRQNPADACIKCSAAITVLDGLLCKRAWISTQNTTVADIIQRSVRSQLWIAKETIGYGWQQHDWQ